MLLVRIFTVDFYMSPPHRGLDTMYSEFRGSSTHNIPIIRIFGSTDKGQKTCLHIHGVYPYIYIPFEGSEQPGSITYQIAAKLDQAINVGLGLASSNAQHVYKISLVSGIPFYGYHTREHQFLKIYFYNPLIMRKACNLLQNGTILGKVYQLHEAHVPFVLQFMIDYNLHGMNFISLSEVRYRVNPDSSQEDIPPEFLLPRSVHKISVCELEVDGLAEHIVNRLEVNTGHITKNPGIAALWDDEKQRRRNNEQNSQISPCMSQTRINIPPTSSHSLLKEALKDKLKSRNNKDYEIDPNASVYPAETPKLKNIVNASFVETHRSSLVQSSSTNTENTDELDLSNQSAIFNKSFSGSSTNDADAKDLLEILQDLGDNALAEEDSVLSQTLKYREESDDENDIDMSIPMAAVTTPTKIATDENDTSCEDEELNNVSNIFTPSIPQLDGVAKDDDDGSDDDMPFSKKQNVVHASVCLSGSSYQSNEEIKSNTVNNTNLSSSCNPNQENSQKCLTSNSKCTTFESVPDRVKRKLSFVERDTSFNTTLVEEKRVCRYTPSSTRKSTRNKITKNTLRTKENKFASGICEKPNNNYNKSNHNSEELFIDNLQTNIVDEKNCALLKNIQMEKEKKICNTILSKAEEYDNDKNIVCIAGTSKASDLLCDKSCDISVSIRKNVYLLENQSTSSKTEVSKNSLSETFSDPAQSSSESLTPYQKCSGQPAYNSENDFHNCNDETCCSQTEQVSVKKSVLEKIKLTQSLSTLETSSVNTDDKLVLTSCGCHVLMPKFNPPSREMIQNSLHEYDVPTIRHQIPFYSDYADVTGEVQIGHNVLKIGSSTSDLREFECHSVDHTLQQLRKFQVHAMYPNAEITYNKLKSIKSSFYGTGSCVLTPSRNAPSRREVELWIKAKHLQAKSKTDAVQQKQKVKILVPCSPGAHSDSDESVISISPFSPVEAKSRQLTNEEEDMQQTPKRSMKSKTKAILEKKSRNSRGKLQKKSINLRKIFEANTELSEKKKNKAHSMTNDPDSTLRRALLQSQFLNNLISPADSSKDSCQITAASFDNTHGFKMSLENLQNAKALSEHQYLTVLVIELHIQTRLDFKPNPELDPIRAIFYSISNDVPEDSAKSRKCSGVFVVDVVSNSSNAGGHLLEGTGVTCDVTYVDSEICLIDEFIKFVRVWDPDIFAGYEIEMLSWGYLIERGYVLGINLHLLLARTQIRLTFSDDETNSELKLPGRIILDVWRLMRHEVALQSYTFENIVYHILHKRVPLHSFKDLSFWWEHNNAVYRHRTVNFYLYRVIGILELFERLDLIGRTSELARLLGIQFYEVLSRGSQFRVESMMLRLAKPLNYVAVSPSVQQRAKMKAPEFLPLILEPQSKFFVDPVIVLDFQSLYPSIIIAYNYCFSTCLGRVEHLGQNSAFTFGATQLKISNLVLKRLCRKDLINFSPCGAAFVKAQVREGILPRMLTEILDTRLMVKKSMKQNKSDKLLQRVLHSRQLGLKLIANVTYGYTAANFSGRMPCVEIADSVVSKGRETLLRAIKLIENTPHWGAKVVYGDTDSVFVLVPGRSRQCSFKIGAEIAEAVTNDNPSPIKLKLEKVYHPCILQTKKRYVGYMYESEDQSEPEFCAKGIETVRRDGCPAVSKMLEKCLKILFDTRDVSLVRKYVVRQFSKLLGGRISFQDLIFAKEYRGASSYRPGACVPALELARRWLANDKRSEPRVGERVPYVIINGSPGLPLIKLVRSPRELLGDFNLLPNVLYYITRVIIPPLNRCFTLIGADLNTWFNEMPRKQMYIYSGTPDSASKKRAISHYFSTTRCVACSRQTQQGLCIDCCNSPQETIVILQNKIRLWEKAQSEINLICQSCCGRPNSIHCISLDCPVMYRAIKTNKDLQQSPHLQQIISTTFNVEF